MQYRHDFLYNFNVNNLMLQQSVRQLTEPIRKKAIDFLETGYQRQLTYKHKDGSYSAFGPSSGTSGSTWLTAFVVRSFMQAKPHIYVDTGTAIC